MRDQQRAFVAAIGCVTLTIVAFYSRVHSQEPANQTGEFARKVPGVDVEGQQTLTEILPKIERVLRRIQNRTTEDLELKQLANVPIVREERRASYRLGLGASTNTQVEIPTRVAGTSVQRPGRISISLIYSEAAIDESNRSGLYHGSVLWRTNHPHIFVTLYWLSTNASLPDKSLIIVRDELAREGLHLLPSQKRFWPFATTSERLAYLLLPDDKPAVTIEPKTLNGATQANPRVFASPQEVAAAYRDAAIKKDWQTSSLCQTPFYQGANFRELLIMAESGHFPKLVRTMENNLKLKIFDEKGGTNDVEEVRSFLIRPQNEVVGVDRAWELWLHQSVRKRVGDVPRFLADCMNQIPDYAPDGGLGLDCEEIRIEGDRASGYRILRLPAPDVKAIEKQNSAYYLPKYMEVRFRRINGSWLKAHESEGED